ncbi:diaminopimelate epimerase [Pseudoflavonifractor phocaeensis]|uniref:diaminopimelate epimerase n=1 Tax=Pseudoflavonifractor phocaeensis TaxID=1870988 RepID=UPI001F38ABE0|nr:diaminopimelate epimerase [Pseudoflavonifractor phocaeensis]MCF2661854.1 diaminopimelate epimerase [Pseudoflavonifractor phocaeensis]
MRFTKMEGLGNDYIYLNCMGWEPPDLPELAVRLSDRHFGVGSDGLICIKPGRNGDFTMEMYNADGSRGAMCGNGIRCLGKYVYDHGLTRKTCLTIDTDAGPRGLELQVAGGKVERVTVDMGEPALFPGVTLEAEGERFDAVQVSMGNPHAVIFCRDPEQVELERLGPVLERHPGLRERSNVEFAALTGPDSLTVRVWERGSGITLACGTGACAVFAAARKLGLCGTSANVRLPGGTLGLEERDGRIFMTGPARTVFEGETEN